MAWLNTIVALACVSRVACLIMEPLGPVLHPDLVAPDTFVHAIVEELANKSWDNSSRRDRDDVGLEKFAPYMLLSMQYGDHHLAHRQRWNMGELENQHATLEPAIPASAIATVFFIVAAVVAVWLWLLWLPERMLSQASVEKQRIPTSVALKLSTLQCSGNRLRIAWGALTEEMSGIAASVAKEKQAHILKSNALQDILRTYKSQKVEAMPELERIARTLDTGVFDLVGPTGALAEAAWKTHMLEQLELDFKSSDISVLQEAIGRSNLLGLDTAPLKHARRTLTSKHAPNAIGDLDMALASRNVLELISAIGRNTKSDHDRPASAGKWEPHGFDWVDFQQGSGDHDINGRRPWTLLESEQSPGVSVHVYMRERIGKEGLYEFLVRGTVPVKRDALFAANVDLQSRIGKDEVTTHVAEIFSEGPGVEAGCLATRRRQVHWEMQFPWPVGRCDYVVEQVVHAELGDKVCTPMRCLEMQALPSKMCPAAPRENPDVTRVENLCVNLVVWAADASKEEASFALSVCQDSGVWMPTWAIRKAASNTFPKFVEMAIKMGQDVSDEQVHSALLSRFGVIPRRSE